MSTLRGDVAFKVVSGQTLMAVHVRTATEPAARAVPVDGMVSIYLDENDRVVGVNLVSVLPSNVVPPEPPK